MNKQELFDGRAVFTWMKIEMPEMIDSVIGNLPDWARALGEGWAHGFLAAYQDDMR